jgi:hypothetical protein
MIEHNRCHEDNPSYKKQSITQWLKENMQNYGKNEIAEACAKAIGCKAISVMAKYNALKKKLYQQECFEANRECVISVKDLKAKFDINTIIEICIDKYLAKGLMLENDFLNCVYNDCGKTITKAQIKTAMASWSGVNRFQGGNKVYWGNAADVAEIVMSVNQYR